MLLSWGRSTDAWWRGWRKPMWREKPTSTSQIRCCLMKSFKVFPLIVLSAQSKFWSAGLEVEFGSKHFKLSLLSPPSALNSKHWNCNLSGRFRWRAESYCRHEHKLSSSLSVRGGAWLYSYSRALCRFHETLPGVSEVSSEGPTRRTGERAAVP